MADASESVSLTEQEAIAASASLDFHAGKYDASKNTLDQLIVLREKDLKVEMNAALVNYYKSTFTKRKKFYEAINSIIKRLQLEDDLSIDCEYVIIYYNYAVMLHSMKHYNYAAEILEKFIPNSENFDKETNNKINLLLIDIYIHIFQPYKALSLIDNFERTLQSNSNVSNFKIPEESSNKEGSVDCSADPNKFILVLFRTCCYLMLRSVKQSKREIKTIVNSATLPLIISHLKANIELLRGNYTKSLRLLSTILDENNCKNIANRNVIVNNNMAVIYFNQRRYNIAQVYLGRAIMENKDIKPLTNDSILNADLLYNLGITLLMSGHVEQAFEHLMKVAAIYKTNPRLWLRLAECCIQIHQQKNDSGRNMNETGQVIQDIVSSGIHQKLILHSNQSTIDKEKNSSITRPSLKLASLYLDNAIHCLNNLPQLKISSVIPPPSPDPTQSSPRSLISAPSTPLAADEVENIHCSVLVAKCYIHLKLDDPLVTLSFVAQLFAMPKLSGLHRYLASMYQAEALLQIDKLSEIVDILNVEALTDINLIESDKESTASQEGQEQADSSPLHWFPRSLEQARAIMHHNLAVTFALRGESQKSRGQLNKAMNLLGKPNFFQMSSLRIYLDLMEGEALRSGDFIKENYGNLVSF